MMQGKIDNVEEGFSGLTIAEDSLYNICVPNVKFSNAEDEKIGEFLYEDGKWHFEGETAESARVFLGVLRDLQEDR